jgi:hypothetical protein
MKGWRSALLIFWLIPILVLAATFAISTSGLWSNTGTWSGGVLPGTTDDVTMNNNRSVTVQSGDNYTVQSISASNSNTITIDSGGQLTLDNSGGTALSAGNSTVINVNGTLTIIGDLVINNSLTLNVTGTLIITGDVILNNGASLDVAAGGSLSIDGDFTGGQNTDVVVDGNMDVTGTIDTGNNSSLTGTGTVTSGNCTGDPDFCAGAPLPIELINFNAKVINKIVELSWATASEENFDYFAIERSIDGKDFKEIAQVTGNGNSFQRIDYSYTDKFPAIGISYYRLRSIDFDGYTEIFDYALVNVEGVKYQVEVFPNPVTSGVLNVQLNFNLEEEAKVLLYNNVGLVKLELAIDSWLNPLDVSSLTSGSYLIKIITKQGVFVKRILIK